MFDVQKIWIIVVFTIQRNKNKNHIIKKKIAFQAVKILNVHLQENGWKGQTENNMHDFRTYLN